MFLPYKIRTVDMNIRHTFWEISQSWLSIWKPDLLPSNHLTGGGLGRSGEGRGPERKYEL